MSLDVSKRAAPEFRSNEVSCIYASQLQLVERSRNFRLLVIGTACFNNRATYLQYSTVQDFSRSTEETREGFVNSICIALCSG
jgi:hypothetical protein